MPVVHQLLGFNKITELLAFEFDMPDDLVAAARTLAKASVDWTEEPGQIPLTSAMIVELSELLKMPLASERYDWFLEPVVT